MRPAGLLGVHRGLLEADEGGDAEAQGGAEAGPAEGLGVEGVEREAFGSGLGEGGGVEDDDQGALDQEEHAEDLGVEVDLEPAERAGDGHGEQSGDPPGELGVQVGGEEAGDLEAEDAVYADLHGAVRDEGDERGGRAGGGAEAAGDVRVEGAGVVDVAAHLGVADAEQREDEAQDDEEQGLADDAHQTEGRGHDTRDHHQGGARGEYGEQQAGGAEAVGAQRAVLALVGAYLGRFLERGGSARRHGGVLSGARFSRGRSGVVPGGGAVGWGAMGGALWGGALRGSGGAERDVARGEEGLLRVPVGIGPGLTGGRARRPRRGGPRRVWRGRGS